MNLILIERHELRADQTVLFQADRRCNHLNQVLNSHTGDVVRVGLLNGPLGSGRILRISPAEALLQIHLEGPPPPAPLTDLIVALPRPIMLKRILVQVASLGVGRLHLINANRVEKSFFHSSLLKGAAYEEYLRLGLEQAVDTRLPEIHLHPRFKPFVEDQLPALLNEYAYPLLAQPEANKSLPQAASPPLEGRALLALGPEGGWVDFEIDKFMALGFIPFHLGPRILRLETAVTALLAQIDLLRRVQ